MKEKLPHYDTLIIDDKQGRFPGSFFKQLIRNIQIEKDGKTKLVSYPLALGHHIFGGLFDDESQSVAANIKGFLSEKATKRKFGKTLIVTEYIHGGSSLAQLVGMLDDISHANGGPLDYDIATLSMGSVIDVNLEKKDTPWTNLIHFVRKHTYYAERGDTYMIKTPNSYTHLEKFGRSPHVRRTRDRYIGDDDYRTAIATLAKLFVKAVV